MVVLVWANRIIHDSDDPPVAAILQRFESDFGERRYVNPIIIIIIIIM